MTSAQCLEARALLKWSQADLARRSDISFVAIRRFETNTARTQSKTIVALQRAFERAGVIFVEENGGSVGVRLRTHGAQAEIYALILRSDRGSFSLGFQADDLESAISFAKHWIKEIPSSTNAVFVVQPPSGSEIEVSDVD